MLKKLGPKPYLFPMPVLLIATYGENKEIDVMTAAWGGVYGDEKVVVDIDPHHKTFANLKVSKAFTVAVADIPHLKEADYLGIYSANRFPEKFKRSGLAAAPSDVVAARVLTELPITLECEVESIVEDEKDAHVVGRIKNTLADEKLFDASGKIDPTRIQAFVFDTFQNGYYAIGEKVGNAFSDGKELA